MHLISYILFSSFGLLLIVSWFLNARAGRSVFYGDIRPYRPSVNFSRPLTWFGWGKKTEEYKINSRKNNDYTVKIIFYKYGLFDVGLTQLLISSRGSMPNVLLDSNNIIDKLYSDRLEEVKNYQKQSFEGDMDSYFTIYTPNEYKLEATHFLGPDLLHIFKDYFQGFNILIIGGTIDMRKVGKVNTKELEKPIKTLIDKIDRFHFYSSNQEKTDHLANPLKF